MSALPPITQALAHYRSLGYTLVPLRPKTKEPCAKEWQNKTAEELFAEFRSGYNVGLRTEGGLVDVDLDSKEARILGSQFLPATCMRHGRDKARGSHYWYHAEGMTNTVYRDPINNEKIIEIHASKRQTMVWPSIHPETGELVEWEGTTLVPAEVDDYLLRTDGNRLASAATLTRYWPTGNRHDLALALGGALLRNRWDVDSVVGFVVAIADAAGDDDPGNREQAVRDTAVALRAGKTTTGIPTLRKLLDGRIVDATCEWLGLNDHTETTIDDLTNTDKPNPVPFILTFGAFVVFPFPQPDWLIGGFLHRGDISATLAPPKSNKTWLELYMHMCIATGRVAFGRFVTGEPLPTIYVMDDQSGGQLQRNVNRLAIGMGFDLELLNQNMHFVVQQGVRLDDKDNRERLTGAIKVYRPTLITFDTFRSMHALDENDSGDMQRIMEIIKSYRNEWELTISLVHHTIKNTHALDIGTTMRGSSAIWGAVDNLIAIQREVVSEMKFGRVSFDGRGSEHNKPFKFNVLDVEGGVKLEYHQLAASDVKEEERGRRAEDFFNYTIEGGWHVVEDYIERFKPISRETVERILNMLADQKRIQKWKNKDHQRVRWGNNKLKQEVGADLFGSDIGA